MGKSSTVKGVSVSKNSNGTWSVGGNTYSSSAAAASALSSAIGSGGGSSSSNSGGGRGSSSYQFVDPSVLQDAQSGKSAQEIADKWGIGSANQVNNMLTNNENTYGTYWNGTSDLYSGVSGTSAAPKLNTASIGPTNSIINPDINRYGYNSSTGYYQKIVKSANDNNYNGINGNSDDQHYGILYDKDKFSPDETFTLDTNKTETDNVNLLTNDYNRANADLSGVSPDFLNSVNSKLQSAFGISNLNQLKSMYPEQYSSLVDSLKAVSGVRDATDPNSRNLLEGQLQAIIGSAVGAGSDMSKLKVLESSIMNKFKNPEQIKADAQNVVRLQTQGKSTGEIASEMGMSEDQVQQLVLLANGLDSKAGEYYQLKDEAAKDITEDYDTKLQRIEEEKQIALERANRNVERLKEDFKTNLERQKKTNEINAHNADFISGQYGFGFSKRGIEGMDYVNEQARQIIEDITQNYDRNSAEMADGIADIIRNWEYNDEDLRKASEDALTNAKNAYTSNMLAIQQQYGTVGLQAQNALAQNVQNFITQAENIYDNALTRQQQNLTNLITNVGNMNALATQNLTLRQARIQQFQNESMGMNRSQLQQLASQLGMSSQEYGDLANYQVQAVANELNGYVPGAGVQMQGQIQSYLNQGYTPMEALSAIMNTQDFKDMAATSGGGSWQSAGNGYIFNTLSGDGKQLYNAKANGTSGVSSVYDENGNFQKVDLGTSPEEMVNTGIASVNKGQTLKFAPQVADMFNEAYNQLLAQGIELQVGDSYVPYSVKQNSYESGKWGNVSASKSYHVKGQAFDTYGDSIDDETVIQTLLDAGFTRPNAKEPFHWSYGEGKDAFGGKPRNTTAYNMADAILSGVGTLPAKNSKEYSDMVIALNDRVNQIRGSDYPEGISLINYSVINDKELSDTLSQTINSTMQSLYSTDQLMKALDDAGYETGPILGRLAKLNPRNADMAEIEASINQMASNVARGFGEKGVLTDKDIERYMKTIPNEKMGTKAREVVGTLLKAKLYDGLVRTLETQAKSRRDVSMFAPEYEEAINWLVENGFRTSGGTQGRGLTGTVDLSSYGRS